MEKIRLVIVDDHPLVREGIAGVLNGSEFEIVGEADNGREGLDVIQKTHPDMVLIDINMPVMNGIEMLKRSRALYPDIKNIIISLNNDPIYVTEAFKLGAAGYLSKDLNREGFIKALSKIHAGRNYFEGKFDNANTRPDIGKSNESGIRDIIKTLFHGFVRQNRPYILKTWMGDFCRAFVVEILAALFIAYVAFSDNSGFSALGKQATPDPVKIEHVSGSGEDFVNNQKLKSGLNLSADSISHVERGIERN